MASLDDVVTNIKVLAQIGSQMIVTMQSIFPQQTGTTSSASSGGATLPSNPVGFIEVTLLDGTTAKVPYYS